MLKRLIMIVLIVPLLAGCIFTVQAQDFSSDITPPPSPWVGREFDDGDDKFMFAIFSDLNGGERDGIFKVAATQLALLRPNFIMSVGDLIDGGTEDEAQLTKEWNSFDMRAEKAGAAIFRVGGNHDLTNLKMRDVWAKRYGPRYYHFVYNDVLFLVMDSEDYEPARMQEIYLARAEAIKVMDGPNPEQAQSMEYFQMPERNFGTMGDQQLAYFQDVLARYKDVKWTFVFMHKPLWLNPDETKGLQRLEKSLVGRQYTVINGHYHTYSYQQRHGMDYIMLGTTGGSQNPNRAGAFDHLTMVTMDDNGPTLVNLKMDGILDKTGQIPEQGEGLCYQASKCQ